MDVSLNCKISNKIIFHAKTEQSKGEIIYQRGNEVGLHIKLHNRIIQVILNTRTRVTFIRTLSSSRIINKFQSFVRFGYYGQDQRLRTYQKLNSKN